MEGLIELLELLIGAIKSGVSFIFFTLDRASHDAAMGYFVVFVILLSAGVTLVHYFVELVKAILTKFFSFIQNIFTAFFDIFRRKTKVEKVEVVKEIVKEIKVKVIDEKGKSIKHELDGL